jgi:hypothetical protein
MACPNCGSWSVKADRSLAGRLVCARCGEPLGIGAARSSRRRGGGGFRRGGGPQRRPLWWGLAALLAVAALLATLPDRRRSPWDGGIPGPVQIR